MNQVVAAAFMVVLVGLAGAKADAEADAEDRPGYGNYYYGYRNTQRTIPFGDFDLYEHHRDKREAVAAPTEVTQMEAEAEAGMFGNDPQQHQVFKRAADAEADASNERGYGWYNPYKYRGTPSYYRYYWK